MGRIAAFRISRARARAALGVLCALTATACLPVGDLMVRELRSASVKFWNWVARTEPNFLSETDADGLNVNRVRAAANATSTVFDGRLYAAWTEVAQVSGSSGLVSRVRVARFSGALATGAWEYIDGGVNPVLHQSDGESSSPAFGEYDGELYLAWAQEEIESHQRVVVAKLREDGGEVAWTFLGTDVNRAEHGVYITPDADGSEPALIGAGTGLILAWIETATSSGEEPQLRAARMDETGTWTDASGPDGSINFDRNHPASSPRLVEVGGKVLCAWNESDGVAGTSQLLLKQFDPSTDGSWTEPGSFSGVPVLNFDPDADAGPLQWIQSTDGSETYAVWSEVDVDSAYTRVQYAAIHPANGTIQLLAPPGGISSSSTSDVSNPTITLANDSLWLVWSESAGTVTRIISRVAPEASPNHLETVGSDQPLNFDPSRPATFPRLVAFQGQAVALWQEVDLQNSPLQSVSGAQIRSKRNSVPDEDWTVNERVLRSGIRGSTSGALVRAPAFGAETSTGGLYTTWIESREWDPAAGGSTNSIVRVAQYAGDQAAEPGTMIDPVGTIRGLSYAAVNDNLPSQVAHPRLSRNCAQVHATWSEQLDGVWRIQTARYTGTVWQFLSSRIGLNFNPAHNAQEPVVECVAGKLTVFWTEGSGLKSLRGKQVTEGAGVGSPWNQLTDVGANGLNYLPLQSSLSPQTVVNGSDLYVFWIETDTLTPGGNRLLGAKFLGDFVSPAWSYLTTTGINYNLSANVEELSVASFDRSLYIAWRESLPDLQSKVHLRRYVTTTENFLTVLSEGASGLNAAGGSDAFGVSVARYGNGVVVGWSEDSRVIAKKIENPATAPAATWLMNFDPVSSSSGLNLNSSAQASRVDLFEWGSSLYLLTGESGRVTAQRYGY